MGSLFLEATSVFFLFFALIGGAATMREYKSYAAGNTGPARVWLGVAFTVIFAYFAISSLWRARQKNLK